MLASGEPFNSDAYREAKGFSFQAQRWRLFAFHHPRMEQGALQDNSGSPHVVVIVSHYIIINSSSCRFRLSCKLFVILTLIPDIPSVDKIGSRWIIIGLQWVVQTNMEYGLKISQAAQMFPVLRQYEQAWPADDFASIYLKNTSAHFRQTERDRDKRRNKVTRLKVQ